MGVVIAGLLSFLFVLILILAIAGALWIIFYRVILPLGLIVLLGMGIYWVYEKIFQPKEQEPIITAPRGSPRALPDVFVAPKEVEKI